MKKNVGKGAVALLLATNLIGGAIGTIGNVQANVAEVLQIAGELKLPSADRNGIFQGSAVVGDSAETAFVPYEMQVEVVVSGGVITGITYSGVDETNDPYARKAYEGVCRQVIGKESDTVEVDVVSSATYSSKAFVSAIGEACKEEIIKTPKIKKIVITKNGLKIQWKKVKDANAYIVYRGNKKVKKVTKNYYIDKKAKKNGKKYTYKVVAMSGERKSEASKKVNGFYLNQPYINILLNASPGKMTLTWTKNDKATGYEVQYSTKKNFKKATTRNLKSYEDIITTFSGVNRGTTYYLRVRAYKKVDGKKMYSLWSPSKKLTIYQ